MHGSDSTTQDAPQKGEFNERFKPKSGTMRGESESGGKIGLS